MFNMCQDQHLGLKIKDWRSLYTMRISKLYFKIDFFSLFMGFQALLEAVFF